MLPSRTAGVAFVVAAVALAGLGIAELTFLSASSRVGYDHGGFDLGDERAVLARAVRMDPGDRLVVRPELFGGPFPTLGNYTFYVAAGGDRYAFLDGGRPDAVHVEVSGLELPSCCSAGEVVWTRPDGDLPPAPPPPEFPRDADERTIVQAALVDPAYVDLVWVFDFGPGFRPPEDADERRRLEGLLEGRFREATLRDAHRDMPVVVDALALRVQPILLAAMAGAALVAAASAGAWVVRLGRAPRAERDGTEGLLRLYDAAGTYLAALRDLLVASFVVAVLVALHVALQGEPRPLVDIVRRAGIAPIASRAFGVAVFALYGAVVVGWVVTLVHVQRALGRWRRRAEDPPLEV